MRRLAGLRWEFGETSLPAFATGVQECLQSLKRVGIRTGLLRGCRWPSQIREPLSVGAALSCESVSSGNLADLFSTVDCADSRPARLCHGYGRAIEDRLSRRQLIEHRAVFCRRDGLGDVAIDALHDALV